MIGLILFGAALTLSAMAIAQKDYEDAESAAADEVARKTDQAEAAAEHARAIAEAQLEAQIGQLGDDFETYDAWYNAQVAEYDAAAAAGSYTGSFEDYLREEQSTELGEYGRERAQLESAIQIAERQLANARENVNAQYEFAEREYDAGVTASNRTSRSELAAAAAMGVRAGAPLTTAAENQRVRMESLDLYLDRATQSRDYNLEELGIRETEMANSATIAFGGLDAALSGARTSYDLEVAGVDLDLQQYIDDLNAGYETSFNDDVRRRHILSSGIDAAQFATSVFTTGANVGAWNFNADGTFWNALNIGGDPITMSGAPVPAF